MSRKHRRRHFWLVVLSLVVLVTGMYGFLAYQQTAMVFAANTPTLGEQSDSTTTDLAWPPYGESAMGVAGYDTIATHGAQTPVPTASIAKIMTALAVLKQKPLKLGQQGPTLVLTSTDVASYNAYLAEDGSVVKVAAGERITEYQALEAMLLPSGNNMADTLAKWAFGSLEAYSVQANNLAGSLAMSESHFGSADASGLSSETTSTAHDLVLLGEAALQSPVIASIVAEKQADVPVAGVIPNVNWMLGEDGVNGIKTGSNDQDKGVYLFSAKQTLPSGQAVTFVGAIMGAPHLLPALDASIPLLNSARLHFAPTVAVKAGQVVGHYSMPWGGSVEAVAAEPLTSLAWQGSTASYNAVFQPFRAPLTKGSSVGVLRSSIEPKQAVAIVIGQAVSAPKWYWRVLHQL